MRFQLADSRSICSVKSGNAAAPRLLESLSPLYSGGLWLAVKLIPLCASLRMMAAESGSRHVPVRQERGDPVVGHDLAHSGQISPKEIACHSR